MAKEICSIGGCGKPARARCWCCAHWKKWRTHGDPMAGRTNGEALKFFDEVVRLYDGDDCLFWPHGADIRGAKLWKAGPPGRGQMQSVARMLCEVQFGQAPTPDHEAAHSCGNGHLACVAKRHLSWKTHADNMKDMILHGTSTRGERNSQSKLTKEKVLEIKRLRGTLSQSQIANRFYVSPKTISKIHLGERWGWLND